MTYRVTPFVPEHLPLMHLQSAQFGALAELTGNHLMAMANAGPCLTAFDDEEPLLCGGIAKEAAHRGTLWAFVSANAGRHFVRLDRSVRRFIETQGLQRIEATVDSNFRPACRWIAALGFDYEGCMHGYGARGETHYRYARVL